jgi:HSP20 family molecular chaperone IbpA
MASRGEVERWLGTPRLLDWLEHEFPLFPSLRPFDAERLMRCEEFVEDDRFVVRAELPGIDPDKDVDVTVSDGVLRIHAVRREEKKEKHRSEFFYGELTRTLTLPKGADATALTASYRDGVLEVSTPIKVEEQSAGTKIPVKRAK